ncbi:MAG: hypothetical protein RI894_1007 [Bacteroidota bacterium]|jgi:acyl carrier protein phosphodiesterase
MNHLAHAFLGKNDDEWIVGNFIADYARGAVEALPYTVGIKKGIEMHRAIDNFTDTHDAIHAACAFLHASQHKYAPIVIDVCFDYFIATDWARLSPNNSLNDFNTQIVKVLQAHYDVLPPAFQKRLPMMIQNNFLVHYAKYDGLQFAFESLAKRTKYDNKLLTALDDFKQNEAALKAIFETFFPELQAFIASNY